MRLDGLNPMGVPARGHTPPRICNFCCVPVSHLVAQHAGGISHLHPLLLSSVEPGGKFTHSPHFHLALLFPPLCVLEATLPGSLISVLYVAERSDFTGLSL